uniref:Protein S-acyltransferase n=2 Tax=Meloidogyne TaxID=189290 RepID=A0A915N4Q1_MELJA
MRHLTRRLFGKLFCCCHRKDSPNKFNVEICFNRIFPIVNFLMRRVLGRFLYIKVYCILAFVLFVSVAIVIPYESLYKPFWVMIPLCFFAVYIAGNLLFHFNKACRVGPGSPKKSDLLPRCFICNNHKPVNAHHCSICGICVAFTTNKMFCDSDILAKELPWFEFICGHGPSTLVSIIFAAYLLCLIVFVMIGGFFYWNFVLISFGDTYLGVIINAPTLKGLVNMFFFPCRNEHFHENWRRFLGLDVGNRTFIRHILLPSSHDASGYFEWTGRVRDDYNNKLCGEKKETPITIV